MTLTLNQIYFERNELPLLNKVNVSLTQGNWLQVIGKNGSGKSTLLRIMAGLIEPTEGTITWNQQPITEEREHYTQAMHYLGHLNGIRKSFTVSENLKTFAALEKTDIRPDYEETLLEKIQLTRFKNQKTQTLSEGQARRLALSKLLLTPKPLWLLDEPFNGLDLQGQQFFKTILQDHLNQGGLLVIATHEQLALTPSPHTITLGNSHA